MARIPRLTMAGEPAVYHIISRTALDGFVLGDVEKEYLLTLIQRLSAEEVDAVTLGVEMAFSSSLPRARALQPTEQHYTHPHTANGQPHPLHFTQQNLQSPWPKESARINWRGQKRTPWKEKALIRKRNEKADPLAGISTRVEDTM